VIEASFSSKSKPPSAKILVNFDNSNKCLAPSKSDWDYSYQTSWDCFCNIGLYQSPIPLTESPTMKISHGVLSFKYTKAQNPIAVPKNHREIDIHGNFGSLIYQISEKEAQRFVSYKISFKFPSEHRINGKEYPLEVVVFHRNKESLEEAALSILVKEDSKGETELNKFFEDIDSQTWSFDEEVSIQSKPDLRYLVAGEDGESRKGFFSYMGSRSNPPCNENVERFVFKKALKIPISQLMSLKKKASKGNNARIVKEETNRRIMVYYNKGKKTLEKDREVEREIRGQVKEKLDRTKNRLFPKKYVKVSTNTTDYIVKYKFF